MQIRRFISSPGSLIQANILLVGLMLMLVLAATACGSSDDTVASESGAAIPTSAVLSLHCS